MRRAFPSPVLARVLAVSAPLLGSGLLLSCAAAPDPVAPKAVPSAKTPKPSASSTDAASIPVFHHASRVSALISAEPKPEPVLAALPVELRHKLESTLNQLDVATQRGLLDHDSDLLHLRPLLHLSAGGNETEAYTALFSSPAAANELLALGDALNAPTQLTALVNEVSRRAAGRLLQLRQKDLKQGSKSAPMYGEIAAAANILGNRSLEIAALDALAELSPTRSVRLRRVRLHAEQLDLTTASQLLDAEKDLGPREKHEATQWLDAAHALSLPPAPGLDPAIVRAQAALLLVRPDDASLALAAFGTEAARDLRFATATVRATLQDAPCPGLRRELANPEVCHAAWKEFRVSPQFKALEDAWKSGSGRERSSVDAYLGLVHVTALLQGFDESAGEATPESVKKTLRAIESVAGEAAPLGPHYAGVSLMARALGDTFAASVDAKAGTLGFDAGKRKQLIAAAGQLAANVSSEPFNQAAVLAVSGVLAQLEDTSKELKLLQGKLPSSLQATHGSLAIWNQLASHDAASFKSSLQYYGEIAKNQELPAYERSRWLLSWGEAEYLLTPNEHNENTLRALCEKLKSPSVAMELRLRSALTLAGLAARKQQYQTAVTALAEVAGAARSSVQTRQEQELLIVAVGYHQVLLALADPSKARDSARNLSGLLTNINNAGAASALVQLWLALWRGELEAVLGKQQCAGNVACEKRADKARGIDRKLLVQNVGSRTASMLDLNFLPVGGVQVEFQYQNGRLTPIVNLDTAFVAVHVPALNRTP